LKDSNNAQLTFIDNILFIDRLQKYVPNRFTKKYQQWRCHKDCLKASSPSLSLELQHVWEPAKHQVQGNQSLFNSLTDRKHIILLLELISDHCIWVHHTQIHSCALHKFAHHIFNNFIIMLVFFKHHGNIKQKTQLSLGNANCLLVLESQQMWSYFFLLNYLTSQPM